MPSSHALILVLLSQLGPQRVAAARKRDYENTHPSQCRVLYEHVPHDRGVIRLVASAPSSLNGFRDHCPGELSHKAIKSVAGRPDIISAKTYFLDRKFGNHAISHQCRVGPDPWASSNPIVRGTWLSK